MYMLPVLQLQDYCMSVCTRRWERGTTVVQVWTVNRIQDRVADWGRDDTRTRTRARSRRPLKTSIGRRLGHVNQSKIHVSTAAMAAGCHWPIQFCCCRHVSLYSPTVCRSITRDYIDLRADLSSSLHARHRHGNPNRIWTLWVYTCSSADRCRPSLQDVARGFHCS